MCSVRPLSRALPEGMRAAHVSYLLKSSSSFIILPDCKSAQIKLGNLAKNWVQGDVLASHTVQGAAVSRSPS